MLTVSILCVVSLGLGIAAAKIGVDLNPTPKTTQGGDNISLIGEEQAKAIALEKAGLPSSDGVRFDRVELDRDNGIWKYEVEFKKGFTEYDAEISATDGNIISWEIDR